MNSDVKTNESRDMILILLTQPLHLDLNEFEGWMDKKVDFQRIGSQIFS